MQLSQAVRDRVQLADNVEALIDQRGDALIAGLNAQFFPPPIPVTLDVRQMLYVQRDLLLRTCEELITADEELALEADDDQQYRDARDQAMVAIRGALNDAVGMLHAACEPTVLTRYGLDLEIPRSPERLQEYTTHVIRCMRAHPNVEDSPYGFRIELTEFADQIERELHPLIAVMGDIRREIRELQEALQARNAALARFDAVYTSVSSIIQAYLQLTGGL